MKQIALTAALGIGLAAAAQAAETNWILIGIDPAISYDQSNNADVPPTSYDLPGCIQAQGQLQGILYAKFPRHKFIVVCAQVPGLSQ